MRCRADQCPNPLFQAQLGGPLNYVGFGHKFYAQTFSGTQFLNGPIGYTTRFLGFLFFREFMFNNWIFSKLSPYKIHIFKFVTLYNLFKNYHLIQSQTFKLFHFLSFFLHFFHDSSLSFFLIFHLNSILIP